MCGIVGALAFGKLNKKDEAVRQNIMRFFTTELLINTEARGKDATGAAVLFDDGNFIGTKRGDKVSEFLSKFGENKDTYGGFLKVWREHDRPVKVYLGHCRAGTGGGKEDNVNNHPIKVGNLVGIHNGTIKNDDEIIKNLGCKRDGKVDSEAIFRLFEYYTNNGKEPFTMKMLQEIVDRLDGQFAVTLFNADNPYQMPVFRDGRPVEFVLIRKHGILLIVSEPSFWSNAHFGYERLIYYHGLRLPSLIDTGIEKESLQDDSCMIFDLTKKVGEDTHIKDLGEWSKMERNHKVWTVSNSYTHTSYTGVNKGLKSGNTWDKESTSNVEASKKEEKKTRVFDKIEKRYIAKIGDKVLKEDESAIISTETEGITSDDDQTKLSSEQKDSLDNGVESTDGRTEEGKSEESLEIKDYTNYDSGKGKESTEAKTAETPHDMPIGKDGTWGNNEKKEGDKDRTSESLKTWPNGEVVEIDMTQEPRGLVEAAGKAYKDTPFEDRGYSTIDELLSAIDIKDEGTARQLGLIVIANRVDRDSWKKGFIAGCKHIFTKMSGSHGEKEKKREKYIIGLKSLVILLAIYFNENIAVRSTLLKYRNFVKIIEGYISHPKNKNKIDIDNLRDIFSSEERGIIETVFNLIGNAGTKRVEPKTCGMF